MSENLYLTRRRRYLDFGTPENDRLLSEPNKNEVWFRFEPHLIISIARIYFVYYRFTAVYEAYFSADRAGPVSCLLRLLNRQGKIAQANEPCKCHACR